MNIKIEQNMSISDLPEISCLDLKSVGLFDRNEKPWSKHAISVNGLEPFICAKKSHLDFTLMFLRTEQQFMNDMCRTRGHLFLNEVYDRLQAPRTKDGQVMGWFANKKNKNETIVEFTVYIDHDDIMVDFNMDGNILDIFDYL